MKRLFFLLCLTICVKGFAQDGKILEFKYREGDNFSLSSTVIEEVRFNGRLSHRAEIISRVTERVEKVDSDGKAFILASFMTSEKSTSSGSKAVLSWGDNFESEYWRDKSGKFTIDDKYFMPVIRDLPVFPERPVKVGDEWSENGWEAEDLRRTLNVQEPFKVPFKADYKFLREESGISSDSSRKNKVFQVISADYNLYYETPLQPALSDSDYPVTTMGHSSRIIWWDSEKGQIDHYEENFRIIMETIYGNTFQFTGRTKVECTEFKRSATEENLKNVQEKISDLGLENISVSKTEQGLKISLENIGFLADSAVLENSEKEKLLKIGMILESYPDNDLLVSGHTARVGSEESCQLLSEKRSSAVASFLIENKIRSENHIFTKGFGSKIPASTNATEEGRSKNRRVEITILDR